MLILLTQVQILVEKDKNMDLKHALELAADFQPIKVDATTIEDVRCKFFCVTSVSVVIPSPLIRLCIILNLSYDFSIINIYL